ncbi:hypothetical protein [Pedobacter sp. Leaf216]|uniref:hypothetical protein n=1 Tax=Pedobacter sp. Leaf216 TaxID=1735684 RepID=UPI001F1A96E7|nr:hypothetical protein [Pedobacter sp. Leaf216]
MFRDFSTSVEMTIRLVFITLSVISSEAQRSREIFLRCTNMFKDFYTTVEMTVTRGFIALSVISSAAQPENLLKLHKHVQRFLHFGRNDGYAK